jgi:hypothetical protein
LARTPEAWLDGEVDAGLARSAMGPDTATLQRWAHAVQVLARHAWAHARHGVEWLSAHTGLPATLLAGVAVVLSWRLAKKSARLVVEVAVATALIAIATHFGWLRW